MIAAVAGRAALLDPQTITRAVAAKVASVFEQHGEFAAAVELRRLFPGVLDNTEARECARAIAAGSPAPFLRRPARPLPANGDSQIRARYPTARSCTIRRTGRLLAPRCR